MHDAIWHWPELPELPPPGRFALVCVRTSAPRAEARKEVRAVLRQIFAAWSQLSPEQLPLKETKRGPVWDGHFQGDAWDVSLSYAKNEAWIALSRGRLIGMDVTHLEAVPEAEAVAQTYFSPADQAALRQSSDPVRDLALAWTQLEARCKCLKCGLTEWSESLVLQAKACATQSLIVQDRLALTVATAPQHFLCSRNA
jgi:phosphopantetheinyl transferase